MRVYIIGNDGITLCREPPTAVNEGEIAVASNEELHAAELSSKRLLALWNALPGVEKRKRVGDRDALIDQLWSAIETLPDRTSRPTRSAVKAGGGDWLLALWNALPGVEKRKRVGDRDALIDQLWSAIETLPDPDQQSDTKRPSKQGAVIAMLQRPQGATVDEVASAMGWQRHTVRGHFSGTLKKKLGLTLASATEERGRSGGSPASG